jgi:hypothetical protein
MLRFSMVSLIEVDVPMVQMMLVRRNSRGGLNSVFRLASHSARVWPKAWWSRELAIVFVCVLW